MDFDIPTADIVMDPRGPNLVTTLACPTCSSTNIIRCREAVVSQYVACHDDGGLILEDLQVHPEDIIDDEWFMCGDCAVELNLPDDIGPDRKRYLP